MRWLKNRLLRNGLAVAVGLALGLAALPAAAQKPTGRPEAAPRPDLPTAVTIVNRSRTRIDVINISPVTDTNWGRDWLGRGVLPAGRSMRFDIQDAQSCAYDIRVIYQDRRAEELRNFDICAQNQIVFTGQNARAPDQAQPQQPPQQQQPQRDPFAPPPQQRPAQRPQQPPPSDGLAPPEEVVITNRSNMAVIVVNFSPTSDPDWGENRLGRDRLAARSTVRYPVEASAGCNYDFRVIYQDQRAEEQRNVDICNGNQVIFTGENARAIQQPQQPQQPSQPPPPPEPEPEPEPTPAPPRPQPQRPQPQQPQTPPVTPQAQGDPDFILVNSSPSPIVAFNASPVTDPNWGEDRLRAAPIAPGARHIVRLGAPGVCEWDVRVIYQDRRAEERRNVNLCNLTELPFTGENAREMQQ